MSWRARFHGDDGAVTIIVALFLMALLFVLALSLDLNALRADIRHEQATSDFAALAAGQELDPTTAYDPVAACEAAWTFALANLEEAPNDTPSPCAASGLAGLATSGCSVVSSPQEAQGTAGPYVITITTPVPDGHQLMEGRLDEDTDGWSCERLGVSVARGREHIFGGVTGSQDATTQASAVVRAFAIGQVGEFASLIVLDRTGCDVLVASGLGTIVVDEYEDPDTGDVTPGIITVDTRGTTCGASQSYAIDARGNQNSRICVGYLNPASGDPEGRHVASQPIGSCVPNGVLFSHGVREGFGPGITSHDPGDVTGRRLAPVPVGGTLVTRAPGDHTYNCKTSYDVGVDPQDPADAIAGCDAETEAPYIDDLVTALGGSGNPGGFLEFPALPVDPVLGTSLYSCNENTVPIVLPAGNWWINCPSNNANPGFRPNVDVTIPASAFIVVEDGWEQRGGVLTVGTDPLDEALISDIVVFVRDGDLNFNAQSTINFWYSMIYLQDGTITSGAGSPTRRFVAPAQGFEDCAYAGAIPRGACFNDLILWSNSSARHTLAGQGLLDLQGVFFTPNAAPFELKGDSSQVLDRAQFISYRIEVSGQGAITMTPNPEFNLETDLTGGGLIR